MALGTLFHVLSTPLHSPSFPPRLCYRWIITSTCFSLSTSSNCIRINMYYFRHFSYTTSSNADACSASTYTNVCLPPLFFVAEILPVASRTRRGFPDKTKTRRRTNQLAQHEHGGQAHIFFFRLSVIPFAVTEIGRAVTLFFVCHTVIVLNNRKPFIFSVILYVIEILPPSSWQVLRT